MMAVLAPSAIGDSEQTITVTMTPGAEATITVENATGLQAWNPTCGIGADEISDSYWLNNSGSIYVTVDVNASNTTAWTLDDAIGHNQFMFNITGTAYWTAGTQFYNNTAQEMTSSFANGGSEEFTMGVQMPSSTSTNDTQTFDVTFVATAN